MSLKHTPGHRDSKLRGKSTTASRDVGFLLLVVVVVGEKTRWPLRSFKGPKKKLSGRLANWGLYRILGRPECVVRHSWLLVVLVLGGFPILSSRLDFVLFFKKKI